MEILNSAVALIALARTQTHRLKVQVEAAISDKTSMEEELEALRAEMDKTSSDQGVAQHERVHLQDTLKRSLAGAQTLQHEVDTVTQDNQRLQGELSALTRVLEATVLSHKGAGTSQHVRAGNQMSGQNTFGQSQVLQQEAGGLRVENGALNAEIDGLRDENSGLRLELLALKECLDDQVRRSTNGGGIAGKSSASQEPLEALQLLAHEEADGMLKEQNEVLKQKVLDLRSLQDGAAVVQREKELLEMEVAALREENQGLQVLYCS